MRYNDKVKGASGGGWDAISDNPVFEKGTGLLELETSTTQMNRQDILTPEQRAIA